jgi:hypothetical protein
MSLSGVASNAASWLPSAFVRSVPAELFVKYGNAQPVEVSTARCNNVSKFIKAVMKEMPNTLGSFDPQNITLHIAEDADALNPMLLLRDAVAKHGIRSDTVLIVKTIPVVAPIAQGNT